MPGLPLGNGYESNGERIYFTATSERGSTIRARSGTGFGGMMMGSPSCAACHDPDGRGGIHWMHMQVMEAPDIRWSTLISGEHGGHGEGEAGGEEMPYDERLLKRAILEGIGADGKPLSRDMPRWEMGEEDLEDLIAFLQSLP